jgi:predicted dehydrogenase
MSRLRMAVIGVGHLGKEHARILASLPEVELVGVADIDGARAEAVARRLGTQAYTDYWPLLHRVDAATIVVPTTFHFAVAAEFLGRGIPVLVEKPLAASLREAELLAALAERHHTLLQVGHIERFNPAFEQLCARPLQPKFISCQRLGPFTGRSLDIGVVLDLMIHDLDLILALTGAQVERVEAVGASLLSKHEDVANARLQLSDGCLADVTASRLSPVSCRRMQVWAPEGYARVDFRQRRLLLAQPRQPLRPWRVANSSGPEADWFAQCIEQVDLNCNQGDQLTRELQEFITCVRTGRPPRVGGREGCAAVALAEQVLHSLRQHAWEGTAAGPVGPHQLPAPRGRLFSLNPREAAA